MSRGRAIRDEFVSSTKPTGPDLTGGAQITPLSTTPTEGTSTEPVAASPVLAKPASEYSYKGGVAGDADDVRYAFLGGGASMAAQKLSDLTLQHANEPGYADQLFTSADATVQQIADQLGARASNGSLDDGTPDASRQYNTTYESLKNLSVVADKLSPENLKALGQKLAATLPDQGDLNQLGDKLKTLKDESMPGLDKLAGSLVTALQESGKNAAADALKSEHKPLNEVTPAPPDNGDRWASGMPLSKAKNAHTTNVRSDFEDARKGDYTFFEGDVSMEVKKPGEEGTAQIEMRHDDGKEAGDNLTLTEWLNKAKKEGVGVKLDVKDAKVFDHRFLEEVRASGIPQERLMFNLGYGKTQEHADDVRRMFPNATLAINPPDGLPTDEQVAKLKEIATRPDIATGPVTFVFEQSALPSKEQIADLQKIGPVSVWQSSNASAIFSSEGWKSDEERAQKLRDDLGIAGMIDLKPKAVSTIVDGAVDFVADKTSAAVDKVKDGWNNTKDAVKDTLGKFKPPGVSF